MSRKFLIVVGTLPIWMITQACGPARNGTTRQQATASAPLPLNTIVLNTSVPKETSEPRGVISEDEFLKVELSRAIYLQSERIEVRLIIKDQSIYFQGPCDRWFERQTDVGWEKVGNCSVTFDDEPGYQEPGSEIEYSMPTLNRSDIEAEYRYELIPGTYRYAISYWDWNSSHVIYSPAFTIIQE